MILKIHQFTSEIQQKKLINSRIPYALKGRQKELTFPESFLYKEEIAQWIKAEAQSQSASDLTSAIHEFIHTAFYAFHEVVPCRAW